MTSSEDVTTMMEEIVTPQKEMMNVIGLTLDEETNVRGLTSDEDANVSGIHTGDQEELTPEKQMLKDRWSIIDDKGSPLSDGCSLMQAQDTTKNKENDGWTTVGKKGK